MTPLSSVFFALAALAIAIRVLVPPGFMPAFGSDKHYITLEFCSGHSTRVVLLDPETGERVTPSDGGQDEDEPGATQPCAFAAASASVLLAPAPRVVAGVDIWSAPLPPPSTGTLVALLISHLPWSTGPPNAAM